MFRYRTAGHAYLICPRLRELDARHAEHPSKWPACRRGNQCSRGHAHEETLTDPEGHLVNDFYWWPGHRPPTAEELPVCPCGKTLELADLDDFNAPAALYDPAAGRAPGLGEKETEHAPH